MAKFSASVAEVVANVRDPLLIDRPDFGSMFRAVRTLDEQLTEARAEIERLRAFRSGVDARLTEMVATMDAGALARAKAEADELRAEIAALRGLPEGAVSGWALAQEGGGWECTLGSHTAAAWVCGDGSVRWGILTDPHPGQRGGTAPTLRDAMRAADKAAGVTS